jgi:radical S-adenosyl methionine domain-containing protein 2
MKIGTTVFRFSLYLKTVCKFSTKTNKERYMVGKGCPYVVNLHLLESCNYQCKHCFAHFDRNNLLSVQSWKQIIDNITEETAVSRFNLAGGEPLLYTGLEEIIEYINSKGIQVSIISNASLISQERIRCFKNRVAMLGLSIDALNPELLRKMGRCTPNQETLDWDRSVVLCKSIKKNGINLKINTVVSKLNRNENLTDFIKTVCPNRWKLLKMKRFSFEGFDNCELEITENEFKRFCAMHTNLYHVEEKSLINSYIIVDAGGRLLDNNNDSYKVVADLTSVDFKTAFHALPFNEALYEERYGL